MMGSPLKVSSELEQQVVAEARAREIEPQKLLDDVLSSGMQRLAEQNAKRQTLLQQIRAQPQPQTLADLKPRRAAPPGQSPVSLIAGQWPGEETEAELLAALQAQD